MYISERQIELLILRSGLCSSKLKNTLEIFRMEVSRILLKQHIQKKEDHSLSFRLFDLSAEYLETYAKAHKKDHFCLIFLTQGSIKVQIEDDYHKLKPGKVSVIFPDQIQVISDISDDVSGKVLLFDEVLFCSDILNNELTVYNVNLSARLRCVQLTEEDFEQTLAHTYAIEKIYATPSLIKKEQARFYIKILLLGIIEALHGEIPMLHLESDKLLYIQFKKVLNTHYKEYRTVKHYADKLAISTKKLNAITKKHCGETAINAIHNRILTEIKRQMLYSDLSHKQIALDLGFSSPSALHKFVKAKLKETPSDLQFKLEQMYNA
ncbi:helix-turn-helix domain-containing protein [Chondrinema litorale]|uniref:helix-turn-helix domain-containing protein n=1 Tax=Chondrinema litorale TaxID=2994555 RepID=UPI0025439D5A|nr:helix-turn-helix domain-containing protein [Chondrinema litorale]UZR96862.1 helix-turn-helix domain-containing protein [Chondrinema litorale]